jgi:glyoxylase-like metal-dependent hydrolase (beta-lactamase superfamily II)
MIATSDRASPPDRITAKTEVIELAEGRLYAFMSTYELDGRVSTHPSYARGFASMNSYLLVEGDECLLIDAGLSVHQTSIIAQLASIIDPFTPLSIWPLRIGEYSAVGNVNPIAERFNVVKLYAAVPDPTRWIACGRRAKPPGSSADPVLDSLQTELIGPGDTVFIGTHQDRRLEVLRAPLRPLSTHWVYDCDTATLFTSDTFTHAWRETPEGPWQITCQQDDPTDELGVWDYLAHARFWWLPGARTDALQDELAAVFSRHDVATLAPAFGCVLRGRQVVKRHWGMLADILAAAPSEPAARPPGCDRSMSTRR